MPRAFFSAGRSFAFLRRATEANAGKSIAERNGVFQALVSIVSSMIMTALAMYGFVGVDLAASVPVGQIWRMGMSIAIVAPALIAPLMFLRIGLLLKQLERARDQLDDMAKRDALTGLLNRRGFETAAEDIWSGRGGAVAVLMCDIDRFKSINDAYGHDIGDLALVHVAGVLRESIGAPGRVLARLGGEEFAVLLHGAGLVEACAVAEKLRAACEASPLKLESATAPITLSIGVATQARENLSLRRLLGYADKALYQAKQDGRNRVSVAPVSLASEPESADRPPFGERALAAA
jgi:diguanylate cyclase (GGDEF)-like protein